jgi:hypothetical protein
MATKLRQQDDDSFISENDFDDGMNQQENNLNDTAPINNRLPKQNKTIPSPSK